MARRVLGVVVPPVNEYQEVDVPDLGVVKLSDEARREGTGVVFRAEGGVTWVGDTRRALDCLRTTGHVLSEVGRFTVRPDGSGFGYRSVLGEWDRSNRHAIESERKY